MHPITSSLSEMNLYSLYPGDADLTGIVANGSSMVLPNQELLEATGLPSSEFNNNIMKLVLNSLCYRSQSCFLLVQESLPDFFG